MFKHSCLIPFRAHHQLRCQIRFFRQALRPIPSAAMADPRFRSWPITEAAALESELTKMGLKVPAAAIDGTSGKGNCLSDALVSVGPAGRGGTGSFVSKDGLVITNHHVAYDAVRQASTVEHDYLADGFVSRSREDELAGPDYELWITRLCEDVSDRVLEVVRAEADPLTRANKVRDCKQEIAKEREASLSAEGMRCEVQEMWADKSYVLFTYERLRDVRIVYVPPKSLGNFGGDTDNFEWPRHTADFTLFRAYVGPDGKPADPSPANVPYQPSRYLQVSRQGAAEGDFIFLLGFPGHTMRYAPSSRLKYSDEVAVPSLVDDFGRKLDLIATHATDRAAVLKLDSAKKSLANEYKRSKGKRVMMRKLELLKEREKEEEALIAAVPEAGPVLARLAAIYDTLRSDNPRSSAFDKLQGIYMGSALLFAAHTLQEASLEAAKADGERQAAYRERNQPFLSKRIMKRIKDIHIPNEAALLKDACDAASAVLSVDFPAYEASASELLKLTQEDVEAVLAGKKGPPDDALCKTWADLYSQYVENRDTTKALLSERDQLLAKLSEFQKASSKENFYPDANGALRISAGFMEGYEAADAVRHAPFTTLAGLLDKHCEASLVAGPAGPGEFACPERLVEMCSKDPTALKTPVNCLYSTDTVGGNSGSPVLSASGEFVGINFDRQRQGLMNEFKWSSKYSRSIGVDVRYILWLVGTYDSAKHLTDEMLGTSAL